MSEPTKTILDYIAECARLRAENERLRAKLEAYKVYSSKMESAADIIADHVPTGTSPIIGQWRIQKLQEGIQFLLQACRECAEALDKADRKKGGGE